MTREERAKLLASELHRITLAQGYSGLSITTLMMVVNEYLAIFNNEQVLINNNDKLFELANQLRPKSSKPGLKLV